VVAIRAGIWGAEETGAISEESGNTLRGITDFAAGMGVALNDPDILTLVTGGVGKLTKLKALGRVGDAMGVSAAAKAATKEKDYVAAADELMTIISTPKTTDKELIAATTDALRKFSPIDRINITNAVKLKLASDPKLSEISKQVLDQAIKHGGKPIENKAPSAQVLKGETVAQRATEKPGISRGAVARGETKMLKKGAKQVKKLRKQGRPQAAKTLAKAMASYRTLQLTNLSKATILADLVGQKRAIGILRGITRASRKAPTKTVQQMQLELGQVTKALQEARQKMFKAFDETAVPRGTRKGDRPATKLYAEAEAAYESAMAKWHNLSMELSTAMSDDAEKFLDTLIVRANKQLKASNKRLAARTKAIDGLGHKFRVNPKEHAKIVKAVVESAPKQMQGKIVSSALAVTLRDMGTVFGKLSAFAEETRPGGITGSLSKTMDEYEKLADDTWFRPDIVDLASKAAGDIRPVGIKGMNAEQFGEKLKQIKTARKAAEFIAENAEDESYREIAKRILDEIPDNVLIHVVDETLQPSALVEAGQAYPSTALNELAGGWASGLHQIRGGKSVSVLIRGMNTSDGRTAQTVLHELLHVATHAKIRESRKLPGSPEYKAIFKELNAINDAVVKDLNAKLKAGTNTATEAFWGREITGNPDEIVAWGFTNPEFRDFLKTIKMPGELDQSAWSKFVASIARILGLGVLTPTKEGKVGLEGKTALDSLLKAVDDLIDLPAPAPKAPTKAPTKAATKAPARAIPIEAAVKMWGLPTSRTGSPKRDYRMGIEDIAYEDPGEAFSVVANVVRRRGRPVREPGAPHNKFYGGYFFVRPRSKDHLRSLGSRFSHINNPTNLPVYTVGTHFLEEIPEVPVMAHIKEALTFLTKRHPKGFILGSNLKDAQRWRYPPSITVVNGKIVDEVDEVGKVASDRHLTSLASDARGGVPAGFASGFEGTSDAALADELYRMDGIQGTPMIDLMWRLQHRIEDPVLAAVFWKLRKSPQLEHGKGAMSRVYIVTDEMLEDLGGLHDDAAVRDIRWMAENYSGVAGAATYRKRWTKASDILEQVVNIPKTLKEDAAWLQRELRNPSILDVIGKYAHKAEVNMLEEAFDDLHDVYSRTIGHPDLFIGSIGRKAFYENAFESLLEKIGDFKQNPGYRSIQEINEGLITKIATELRTDLLDSNPLSKLLGRKGIFLNALSTGPDGEKLPDWLAYKGMNAETIVHEILHSVTMEQIGIAANMGKGLKKSTPLGKAYTRLHRVGSDVLRNIPRLADKYIKRAAKLTEEYDKIVDAWLKAEERVLSGPDMSKVPFIKSQDGRAALQAKADALAKQMDDWQKLHPQRLEDAFILQKEALWLHGMTRRLKSDDGTLSVHELVAYGMSHKKFMELLKDVKLPGAQGKVSLWTAFVHSIAQVLGMRKGESALSELLSAAEEVMDTSLSDALLQAGPDIAGKYIRGELNLSQTLKMTHGGGGGRGGIGDAARGMGEEVSKGFSRSEEIYLVRQLSLMSGWTANNDGELMKTWLAVQKDLKNMWDPAQAILGPASEKIQQIGVAIFSQIKVMQKDLVKRVDTEAIRKGQAAIKEAQKAGKFAGLDPEEALKKKRKIKKDAEAAVFSEYIGGDKDGVIKSINGSIINTMFAGKSLWTQAKPMLRAGLNRGKKGAHSMPFKTLAKMWFGGQYRNEGELGALYTQVENLLLYGHKGGKAGLEKKLEVTLTKEEALHIGAALKWEDFSEEVRNITKNQFNIAGMGEVESSPKKAQAFAAQAVTQMALLNHASTRVMKELADFPEDAIIAATRLVSGHSQDPGTDIAKAFDVLNRLKMPAFVREAKNEADTYLKIGLEMYADPSGDFKAFIPRQWMDETLKRLSKVEKVAAEAHFSAKSPGIKKSIATIQGFYRLWQTSILTGAFLPRPAYWTNIYIGNVSQLIGEGRFAEAATMAASPVRDIIWASQRLASHTRLGKYVDATLDHVATKYGTDHPLASLTNALLNKNISQVLDPRLADDSARIAGTAYTMGDIRRMALDQGVLTSFVSKSGLANMVQRADIGKRQAFVDKIQAPMQQWAEFADVLEQRQRIGLFTDLVINRGVDPEEAGRIVREALYDWEYPMTHYEAKLAKNIFMFYNFHRRAMGQGMRILLDPFVKGQDDSFSDVVLKSSPVLATMAGKRAYKTSYVMAMEEMLHQSRQAMITPGEVQRDGSVEGGTDPAYPWWSWKATNKVFLPNTPMSADRGANYTNSVGKERKDPGITHKVMTMPSFTPIEMINNWADIIGVLAAYGVSWLEASGNIIRGKGLSEGVGYRDVGNTLAKHAIAMGGPVSEHALEGVADEYLNGGRESYQQSGYAVKRRSDKLILQGLNAIPGLSEMMGEDSGLIWRDREKEGDAWRTDAKTMALLKVIPGLANEINTYYGPLLENNAEGGEISEGIKDTVLGILGFKTYRYSPEKVRKDDMYKLKKKFSRKRREEERESGTKKKR